MKKKGMERSRPRPRTRTRPRPRSRPRARSGPRTSFRDSSLSPQTYREL